MKTLIMLTAFPASGKSTWAKRYQASHPSTYILSSDAIRMELTGGVYLDRSKQKEVWETFERRIHEYATIPNVTVILDALNDLNDIRYRYLSTTPEYDKKILVVFPSTLEKSQKYNNQRMEEVRVPEDILEMLVNKFEKPDQRVLDLVDEVRYVYWEI